MNQCHSQWAGLRCRRPNEHAGLHAFYPGVGEDGPTYSWNDEGRAEGDYVPANNIFGNTNRVVR